METNELIQKLKNYGADTDGIIERFMGDAELYEECFAQFITDAHFENLGRAIEAQDYDDAFASAHAIKGLAANMGLTPLYKTVCTLVEALRAKKLDDLDAQYAAVIEGLEELKLL